VVDRERRLPFAPLQVNNVPPAAIIPPVVRHLLAPIVPAAAGGLRLPRTIPGGIGEGSVALTFDDGPHPSGTPAMLELLARAGARATFFVIGEQVERRPALLQELVAAGHAVALHGYRHRLQPRLSSASVRDDVQRGVAAIEDAISARPRLHRPPYGIYSPAGLQAARAAGLEPLLWSRWGKDWRKFTTPERIAARVTREVKARDIILLHDADFYSARDSHVRTAAALTPILRELSRRELGTVLPV
jgi:peptidoglycan-N-acetylglucosamine deacetylase